MKKYMFLIVILMAFIISACSSNNTVASLPSGYEAVAEDRFLSDGNLTVVKHLETGCYYTHMDGSYSGAFTQMFVEKNGVSVPYCVK